MTVRTLVDAGLILIAGGALAVSLTHSGPAGTPGATGQPGPAGIQGDPGPAGTSAPSLGYQCQMLFPNQTNGGTETTFYWPCDTKPIGTTVGG